jgi:hypothetical protein
VLVVRLLRERFVLALYGGRVKYRCCVGDALFQTFGRPGETPWLRRMLLWRWVKEHSTGDGDSLWGTRVICGSDAAKRRLSRCSSSFVWRAGMMPGFQLWNKAARPVQSEQVFDRDMCGHSEVGVSCQVNMLTCGFESTLVL